MAGTKNESISITWKDGLSFEADVDGFKMTLDADPDHGGQKKGPKPKPLMLVALAGCTGMDVVSLLNKMRVTFNSFEISVEGELSEEHPRRFLDVKVVYRLKGKGIDRKKVEKAVELSKDKYCGVSASYKSSMEISYDIIIGE